MEADGVTPSQKKIRSFPGMTLYQQRFVIDCSAKAKPLFKLPSDRSEERTRRKCSRAEKPLGAVKLSPVDWTSERRTAFESLKRDLLHSVTLAHPDFGHDFILSVDASFDGIGAVLSQVPPGEKVARPVAFAGKTLSKSRMNYPARRLEFLALKLDACEQRRVAKLAAFDFDPKYVPGTKNIVADEPFVKSRVGRRLLREPCVSLLDEVNGVVTGTVQDAFRVTNNRRNVEATGNGTENELEDDANDSCPGSVDAAEVSAVLGAHCDGGVSPLPVTSPTSLQLPDEDASVAIPFSRLSNLQELDNVVGRVLHYVGRRKRPSKSEKVKEPSSVTALLKQWKKLKVPAERFFWPGTSEDIELCVKNCQRCVVGKTPEPDARAPLEHVRRTSEPMELVCIDFREVNQPNKLHIAFGMTSSASMDFQREYIQIKEQTLKLTFGRIPRLPIDTMFQHVLCDEKVVSHHEFVTALKRDLSAAGEMARRHSPKEQNRRAVLCDRKVGGSSLQVGDRVLLANRGEKGKRKVSDEWDSVLYEVQSVRPEINVYRIKDVQTELRHQQQQTLISRAAAPYSPNYSFHLKNVGWLLTPPPRFFCPEQLYGDYEPVDRRRVWLQTVGEWSSTL
ncbi:retrotransposable element [Pimephales promelas]|nr:retrotransposable element [Pimephales promelas]